MFKAAGETNMMLFKVILQICSLENDAMTYISTCLVNSMKIYFILDAVKNLVYPPNMAESLTYKSVCCYSSAY